MRIFTLTVLAGFPTGDPMEERLVAPGFDGTDVSWCTTFRDRWTGPLCRYATFDFPVQFDHRQGIQLAVLFQGALEF